MYLLMSVRKQFHEYAKLFCSTDLVKVSVRLTIKNRESRDLMRFSHELPELRTIFQK